MLTVIAYGLAIVLSLFIIVIGVRFLLVPQAAAAGYGIPGKENGDTAYLDVKGLRDSSYGVLGLVLLAVADAHIVAWFMLVVTLAPLGDTLIVLRHGGTKAAAFGIHFATAVVLATNAALLFAI
ncbi:DUF4267 domain-containing protein [Pseudonocardia asaccharolytica]|uniref:Membrane protein n=1 Tax=Pseudonocardia asaccharolytica DSM 44247 = NBRC 16224 TaxID=1123024 RepID=A0A511D6J5_9PSEU|nr:DUF4267 domain-containing protein [Pseudonocardia asaccharolytica]GEL20405.1 membrane protein [Pseudonocardia asaccharolytica DSM 44247 = NBRC 16224]